MPPHPNCVTMLPKATKHARNFPLSSEKMMRPTDNRQIQIFLEKSTDWCVRDAPSWLNMRSPTGSHSLQYAQFMVCHSLEACQLNHGLSYDNDEGVADTLPPSGWYRIAQAS